MLMLTPWLLGGLRPWVLSASQGDTGPLLGRAGRALGQAFSGDPSVCLSPPQPLQSFNAYFSSEHSRLLLLWRQVMGLRRQASEVKMGTER